MPKTRRNAAWRMIKNPPPMLEKRGDDGLFPTERAALGIKDQLPFASGGIRSHKVRRFDLIPRAMLECLADRLELGLKVKGDREILQRYRRGDQAAKDAILDDDGWWIEMRNHLQDHVIDLRDADFLHDNLWGHVGAIMWNSGMLAWRERELAKREARDEELKKK